MTEQNITAPTEITPDVDTAVDAADDVDAEEAEYQAEMAKIRGNSKPKSKGDEDDATQGEDAEDDEETEYKKAMEKARRSKSGKDEEDGEESLPKKDAKKEQAKEVWKLKVNGKEIDFDASDKEAVKREVQKGLAANERFEHSAKIEKQAKSFVQNLQSNFGDVITHPSLGIPKEQIISWAEQYLFRERVQPEMMSPEERERMQEKAELETYRKREAREKQEREAQRVEQLKEQFRADWSKKFAEALDSGGLPKTDWTVTRMAQYMRQAGKNGHKHIQPVDVVEYVQRDWINAQKDLYANMDGEKLLEILGSENVDKIRKANLKRYDSNYGKSSTSVSNGREVTDTKPKKFYGSTEEMMRDTRRR
jgi:hypothetical protein